MKRKKLPQKKHKGLFIYCNKCCKYFSWTTKKENGKIVEPKCGNIDKSFSGCDYKSSHKYKVRIHLPGSGKGTTSKSLSATTYEEAVIESIEFKNTFNQKVFGRNDLFTQAKSSRIYLLAAEAKFVDYLADIDVPEHKKQNRSKDNIERHIRSLKYFNEVLSQQKINTRLLPVDMIDDTHVGYFHNYLIKGFGNRSYNKHMGYLKVFFDWVIINYHPKLNNPFIVKNKPTQSNKETINAEEFSELLKIITPENGVHLNPSAKSKRKRNFYSPFLKQGFLLALHTGLRREEIVQLKWTMIKERNHKPIYIEVPNLKVERIKKAEGQRSVRPKIVPVTKGLLKVLHNLGYKENIGNEEYIICSNRSKHSKETIMEKLSKGFSHYYRQLGTNRNLQFKCLRKTYLTYLEQVAKGDTKTLSSHASDQVLQKHYIDERVISKVIQEVEIFG